jgi:hypothetical protein
MIVLARKVGSRVFVPPNQARPAPPHCSVAFSFFRVSNNFKPISIKKDV